MSKASKRLSPLLEVEEEGIKDFAQRLAPFRNQGMTGAEEGWTLVIIIKQQHYITCNSGRFRRQRRLTAHFFLPESMRVIIFLYVLS